MKTELRISDLSKMLDVCPQGVRAYIKRGYLLAHKRDKHIYIYLEDYAQMLCDMPRFRRKFYDRFCHMSEDDSSYPIALSIYQYVSKNRVFYAVRDVAIICDVTVPAILKWVKLGELKKDVDGKFFSREELNRFFKAHPLITRYKTVDI